MVVACLGLFSVHVSCSPIQCRAEPESGVKFRLVPFLVLVKRLPALCCIRSAAEGLCPFACLNNEDIYEPGSAKDCRRGICNA